MPERSSFFNDAAQKLDRIPKRTIAMMEHQFIPFAGMVCLPVFPKVFRELILQTVLGSLLPDAAFLYVLVKRGFVGFEKKLIPMGKKLRVPHLV